MALALKSISLHPKLAAVIDLIISLIFLFSLKQLLLDSWLLVGLGFGIRVCIWLIFIWIVYYPKEMSRWKHLLSLIALNVGSLAFLLFIEWDVAWYIYAGLFSLLSFFSFWLLPASHVDLGAFLKPHLRWRFLMCVVGLAGIFEGAQAIISFQITPTLGPWGWLALAAILAAVFAGWWWWEYGAKINDRFWVWLGAWFVVTAELFWVLNVLPLGYLVSSLILIWCWYVLWLLVRFNLTSDGINWQKQIWFLGTNAALLISFLIFIANWR